MIFLLNDEKLKYILGRRFRRKFPAVSCSLGYYSQDFKVTKDLEIIFNKYRNLKNDDDYQIAFYE